MQEPKSEAGVSVATWNGPTDRMPEAEVSLRLAEFLTELPGFCGHVDVAIDGASVRVHGEEVFDISGYLQANNWQLGIADTKSRNEWAATYHRAGTTMRVHSRSGVGDVATTIAGRRLIAECKKGPLVRKPGSPEYPLLATAIGQALLLPAKAGDLAIAAVPDTPVFRRIAEDWRERPKFKVSGIQIALVSRDGSVSGLNLGDATKNIDVDAEG
ncbi:hypothetical protein CDO30_05000 [Sinorhizobium meliloti]|nr:hypothetical protein CDO30_05000 [Sinorhizobium meliloti]MCK3799595.1 hypothetical protein [Sinorhizobium meliloti]MCK3808572.1 hypothetical protein [Sinorhizobium meliloti]MCK3813341.1 hypothetical protein [Sinorhizobium meliloti]PTD29752.1 hypothetical protein C5N13_06480 [Sinorhizobium meliloti]